MARLTSISLHTSVFVLLLLFPFLSFPLFFILFFIFFFFFLFSPLPR